MHACVSVCVCMRACFCVCVCVCLCLYMCVFLCMSYMRLCIVGGEHPNQCALICLKWFKCICIYVYVSINVRKSLVFEQRISDGDFSEDLGNDANGNLKVWPLGLAAGYLPKLSPYSTTSVPHPVKIYQVDTTGAKMLVYLSINIQPELYE